VYIINLLHFTQCCVYNIGVLYTFSSLPVLSLACPFPLLIDCLIASKSAACMRQQGDRDSSLHSQQCCHWIKHVVIHSGPSTPLYENMTSSTKPEVHNLLHCYRQTEPQLEVTSTEYLDIWFLRHVNKQTYGHADLDILCCFCGQSN